MVRVAQAGTLVKWRESFTIYQMTLNPLANPLNPFSKSGAKVAIWSSTHRHHSKPVSGVALSAAYGFVVYAARAHKTTRAAYTTNLSLFCRLSVFRGIAKSVLGDLGMAFSMRGWGGMQVGAVREPPLLSIKKGGGFVVQFKLRGLGHLNWTTN